MAKRASGVGMPSKVSSKGWLLFQITYALLLGWATAGAPATWPLGILALVVTPFLVPWIGRIWNWPAKQEVNEVRSRWHILGNLAVGRFGGVLLWTSPQFTEGLLLWESLLGAVIVTVFAGWRMALVQERSFSLLRERAYQEVRFEQERINIAARQASLGLDPLAANGTPVERGKHRAFGSDALLFAQYCAYLALAFFEPAFWLFLNRSLSWEV